MATTSTRLTYADLETIPQERPGDRHELIDGELVVTPSPIPTHQRISRNVFRRLDQHAMAENLGDVLYAPLDIRLTPENILVPDIVFIARERLHIIGPKAIDAPPDLVVEVLSPGTRRRDLATKRELYARFGVQEYWIVDPAARTVTVLAPRGDRFEPVPADEDGAIQSRVLPDLKIELNDVFSGVELTEK
jgi:Uma2 family endonuclease